MSIFMSCRVLQEGDVVQGHIAVDEFEDHHFGLTRSSAGAHLQSTGPLKNV